MLLQMVMVPNYGFLSCQHIANTLPKSSVHYILGGAINTRLQSPYTGTITGKRIILPAHEDSSVQFQAEDEAEMPESRGCHHPPAEVQIFSHIRKASTSWLPSSISHTGLVPRPQIRSYAAVFVKDTSGDDTPKSPDFSTIRRDSGEPYDENDPSHASNSFASDPRLFTYMVVGATGVFTAMAARAAVIDFLAPLSPSAATQATAQTELDLSAIPVGKNLIVKWRGKPVFIRHRTQEEIDEMSSVDLATLRDPQNDSDRVQRPEWLVMLGICTHLGCVPMGDSGDFNGWYCPCQ